MVSIQVQHMLEPWMARNIANLNKKKYEKSVFRNIEAGKNLNGIREAKSDHEISLLSRTKAISFFVFFK